MDLNQAKVSAYLQSFKNEAATRNVLSHFRRHYPTVPVLLVSDNGSNLSHIASDFDCIYLHDLRSTGINQLDCYKTQILISRLSLMLSIANESDIMILLEDDVLIKNTLKGSITADFAGQYVGNTVADVMSRIFKSFNKEIPAHQQFGGAGGSIYTTAALKELVQNDFGDFLKRAFEVSISMRSIDYCISMMLFYLGKTYQKLDCLAEIERIPSCLNDDRYSVIHQIKDWTIIK